MSSYRNQQMGDHLCGGTRKKHSPMVFANFNIWLTAPCFRQHRGLFWTWWNVLTKLAVQFQCGPKNVWPDWKKKNLSIYLQDNLLAGCEADCVLGGWLAA